MRLLRWYVRCGKAVIIGIPWTLPCDLYMSYKWSDRRVVHTIRVFNSKIDIHMDTLENRILYLPPPRKINLDPFLTWIFYFSSSYVNLCFIYVYSRVSSLLYPYILHVDTVQYTYYIVFLTLVILNVIREIKK